MLQTYVTKTLNFAYIYQWDPSIEKKGNYKNIQY
jgi:hypothetical protein